MAIQQYGLSNHADTTAVAAINRAAIKKAVEDYSARTYRANVIRDISPEFIDTLARDSAVAKTNLRNILRRVKGWDEQLQAVVINGTRTHDPDLEVIRELTADIRDLKPELRDNQDIVKAFAYFWVHTDNAREYHLGYLKKVAPKAYRKGRKLSRIFNDFAKAVGVYNGAAGSDYQRYFARLADELNAKKIDFKLYLSINPAHFLTMSNPYEDTRGTTMVSCHSLNSEKVHDGYYSAGCTGYARDKVTMIAFTAADDSAPETLNNRKTTRQLFMYSGAVGLGRTLLQSRMYCTQAYSSYGGCDSEHPAAPIYRDLVERVLAEGEGFLNLWKPSNYDTNKFGSDGNIYVRKHPDFGGYADWLEFGKETIKISVQKEALESNDCPNFTVGAAGLCVCCGETISGATHYCEYCDPENAETCYECDRRMPHDDCTWVYNACGDYVTVCDDCLADYYTYCENCDEYHHNDRMTQIYGGDWMCDDCLQSNCFYCDECGEWFWNDRYDSDCDRFTGHRDGETVTLCRSCFEEHYHMCEHCRDDFHEDEMHEVENEDGEIIYYCEFCYNEYYHKKHAAE